MALGSIIGARCAIKPKLRDSWLIVPNLWGGIVGDPSAKKSPAWGVALKPMDRLIAKAQEAHKAELGEYETAKVVFDAQTRQITAAIAGLIGIGPKDELEGMMAAQLIAAHSASIECFRRAMIGEQTFAGRSENLSQANKLSRTFAMLLDALNRHRGKGQQKVTVEHVHVHAGGQAIVGAVGTPGGGIRPESEEQPHAKEITHAPEQAMRCEDTEREAVPVGGHGERSLPASRRPVARRAKG